MTYLLSSIFITVWFQPLTFSWPLTYLRIRESSRFKRPNKKPSEKLKGWWMHRIFWGEGFKHQPSNLHFPSILFKDLKVECPIWNHHLYFKWFCFINLCLMFKVDMNLWFLKDLSDEIVTDTELFWNVCVFSNLTIYACVFQRWVIQKKHTRFIIKRLVVWNEKLIWNVKLPQQKTKRGVFRHRFVSWLPT